MILLSLSNDSSKIDVLQLLVASTCTQCGPAEFNADMVLIVERSGHVRHCDNGTAKDQHEEPCLGTAVIMCMLHVVFC